MSVLEDGRLCCDVCGVPVVVRGGRWVHTDPLRAAFSAAGDHDPVRVDDASRGYLAEVLGGDVA